MTDTDRAAFEEQVRNDPDRGIAVIASLLRAYTDSYEKTGEHGRAKINATIGKDELEALRSMFSRPANVDENGLVDIFLGVGAVIHVDLAVDSMIKIELEAE